MCPSEPCTTKVVVLRSQPIPYRSTYLRKCFESRVGLVKYHETSTKQFSPLWWSCQPRGGLFKCRKYRESRFHHCGGPVKLVQTWLSARRHLESCFHYCGGPVKLVQTWLSARRHLESCFHHCGGSEKLVLACLCARKD